MVVKISKLNNKGKALRKKIWHGLSAKDSQPEKVVVLVHKMEMA